MVWFLDDLLTDGLLSLLSGRFLVWLVLVVLGIVGLHHLPGPTGLLLGLDVVWFAGFTIFWHIKVGWRHIE